MANKPQKGRAKATPAYAKPNPSAKPRTAASKQAAAEKPSPTVWIVVAVVAVLAVAAGIIAVVSSSGSKTPSTNGLEQTQPVTVTGDALPQLQTSGSDSGVGVTAPTLDGLSFAGTPVTIGGRREDGNATLVLFLAHWCPHCQREVPELVKWHDDGKVPEGVDVVGIATQTSSDQPNYPPSAWLEKEAFPWPIMADSDAYDAAAAYGMNSWPGFVLLDKDGKVLWRASGEIDTDTLTTTIEQLRGQTTSSTPASTS